jgi:hypothetical protein
VQLGRRRAARQFGDELGAGRIEPGEPVVAMIVPRGRAAALKEAEPIADASLA